MYVAMTTSRVAEVNTYCPHVRSSEWLYMCGYDNITCRSSQRTATGPQ